MKISNETKIGALTAVSVALLILGFNFLKGKSLFKNGNFLYTKYKNTKGLTPSNDVYINGYQVGNVYAIEAANKNISDIIVTIKMKDDFNIPDNSVAYINTNPLGSPSINIQLGNSSKYLVSEDTMRSSVSGGLMGDITNKLGPVADQVENMLASLDSVLRNVNHILDPVTKGNLQNVISHLNEATAGLVSSSASLQKLLNTQTGALAQSLNNVSSFTHTLANNSEKLTNTMTNLEKTTDNLSKVDIDGVVSRLKASIEDFKNATAKLNSTDGSLGALLNDKQLYNNLNSSVYSLNILADDLRAHPKRYVNISVFGKKDKGGYLTAPLKKDSTTTSRLK
jgi:phospholipid/cholesterol/gamma-HCH transport system substrate-binding protein